MTEKQIERKFKVLEKRIETLEKELLKSKERIGAAQSAAQAALYVANYG